MGYRPGTKSASPTEIEAFDQTVFWSLSQVQSTGGKLQNYLRVNDQERMPDMYTWSTLDLKQMN